MIRFCYETENEFVIVAENQSWDHQTLTEIKEKHGVIFQTAGDGVSPVLVRNNIVALGIEDDGTIFFPKEYNQFVFKLSKNWIPYLISDLTEAMK